jgi:MFS family permease
VVDAGTGLACAVIVALALAPDVQPAVAGNPVAGNLVTRNSATGETESPASAVSPWRDRGLLIVTGSGTVFALVSMLMVSVLPLSLGAVGLNPANAGLIMAVSTGTLVLARPALRHRRLTDLPDTTVFVLGYLMMAAGFGGYAFARTLPALLVPTALYSLGNLLAMGRSFAIVSELAPAGATARYLAVYGLSWGVATLLAPLVGTWLIGMSGPGLLWGTSAAVCAVMTGVQPWIVRRVRSPQVDLAVIHSTKPGTDRYDAVSI